MRIAYRKMIIDKKLREGIWFRNDKKEYFCEINNKKGLKKLIPIINKFILK
jgi:hypothetical protein